MKVTNNKFPSGEMSLSQICTFSVYKSHLTQGLLNNILLFLRSCIGCYLRGFPTASKFVYLSSTRHMYSLLHHHSHATIIMKDQHKIRASTWHNMLYCSLASCHLYSIESLTFIYYNTSHQTHKIEGNLSLSTMK